jgi:hypothetical protein
LVKKSIWAVCSVALLAVAFALPASAQDARDNGPLVAHTTNIVIHPNHEVQPPSSYTVFSNFGSPSATNA